MVCNRHRHSTGQSQRRKPKATPGEHGRVRGEERRDRHEAKILYEVILIIVLLGVMSQSNIKTKIFSSVM